MNLDGTLIGKSFPLVLKDGTGEELPATKEIWEKILRLKIMNYCL